MERNENPGAEVIDLADIVRSIRNGWAVVLGSCAIGVALAGAILLFAPPSFAGKASVLLKTGSSGSTSSSIASAIGALSNAGGALTGSSGGGSLIKSPVETEIEILQSRSLASSVVDSLLLQAQISRPRSTPPRQVFARLEIPGAFKKRTYLFTPSGENAFRFTGPGDSGTATVGTEARLAIGRVVMAPTAPRQEMKIVFRDREETITRVVDKLDFEKPKSEVAHFTFTSADSVTAAAVPNLLMRLYFDRRKGVDRGLNQKRVEFLEAELDSLGRALQDSERTLRARREASGVINPVVTGQMEAEAQARLRQQLTDLKVQEGALERLIADIKAGTTDARQLAGYPQFLGGAISGIVSQLVSIETQRQALLVTRTTEDQDVRALTAQQKNLSDNLLPLAQTTLASLTAQRAAVEDRLQASLRAMTSVPAEAQSFARLERDIMDQSKIYAALETQLVDARLAAITEGGEVRTLDQAPVPKKPAFPKPSVTLAAGLGGGGFIGLLLAVALGIVGGRMHDARDVERRTGLPAVRFEQTAPLLVSGQMARTVLVVPINARASAMPVAERLAETAMSRSLRATLLDLSAPPAENGGDGRLISFTSGGDAGFDANAAIRRLEESHDLVVVLVPALSSRAAGAVLGNNRPVLLVAPERRIERGSLQGAIDLLRRVGAPCAGVVLHGDDRRSIRA